jgi:acetamidase/formamidase
MSIHPFTSESYSEGDRTEAWQDVLGGFGLRSQPMSAMHGEHATALSRASLDGVGLMRFAAAPQIFSPLPRRADLPILLLPTEDGTILKTNGSQQGVPAGRIIMLPRQGDWQVAFHRSIRAIVLSVTVESFGGRRISLPEYRDASVVPSGDWPKFSAARSKPPPKPRNIVVGRMEHDPAELAEMLLTLAHQRCGAPPKWPALALNPRCSIASMRRSNASSAIPISRRRGRADGGYLERYLQKLFEGTGDNLRITCANADCSIVGRTRQPGRGTSFRVRHRLWLRLQRRGPFQPLVSRPVRNVTAGVPATASRTCFRSGRQDRAARLASGCCGAIACAPAGAGDRRRRTEIGGLRGLSRWQACASFSYRGCARVHWGFFSRALKPLIEVVSGDTITVETLTQHASDDPELMITGDPGAESVFRWTREGKGVERRGAGPMDASIYGRGAGEGFGVHICTGPIAVKGAEPGDVLEVRILDMVPRPSRNPDLQGRIFGSSVAAWWGYHYDEFLSEPKPREAVTIYEIFTGDEPYAQALYSYRWQPQTDPYGVAHQTYDYPGIPVAAETIRRRHGVLDGIRIPLRPHFGVIGVAPREAGLVDSVPPAYFGGNLDNWRLGKGAAVYLPVSVPEALLSIGDPHAAQGDGELSGTAIECSMTGTFQLVLHKKADFAGRPFADLTYPLIETETDWVLTGFSHPNYLAEFGAKGQSEVYAKSSLDLAMKDAFRKVRRFLVNTKGLSADEAIALISAAVDFGVTQVVDGNWGVHAILSKRLFAHEDGL